MLLHEWLFTIRSWRIVATTALFVGATLVAALAPMSTMTTTADMEFLALGSAVLLWPVLSERLPHDMRGHSAIFYLRSERPGRLIMCKVAIEFAVTCAFIAATGVALVIFRGVGELRQMPILLLAALVAVLNVAAGLAFIRVDHFRAAALFAVGFCSVFAAREQVDPVLTFLFHVFPPLTLTRVLYETAEGTRTASLIVALGVQSAMIGTWLALAYPGRVLSKLIDQ